jgi:HSP20 family molecular chaperone IbpA
VVEDEVKAEFDNGMLKVICPKAQPAEAKKIDVQVKKK